MANSTGVREFSIDITELERAREELQAQIARLREFVSRYATPSAGMCDNEARKLLSDTADNDKWLAERDAETLKDAAEDLKHKYSGNLERHDYPPRRFIDYLVDLANDIRNQAKKGGV